MKKLNEAVWEEYTNNPKEVGIYINPHGVLRRILFREPEIISVKLRKRGKRYDKSKN